VAAITLRIRQILPQFFADEEVAALTDRSRLIYIGLWCVADDEGYFPWKPGEVAYALGMHRIGRHGIEKAVAEIRALPGRCRVELLPCDRHAVVVNLSQYQRYSKSTHNVRRHAAEHQLECVPAFIPPTPHISPSKRPSGTERNGTERGGEISPSTTEQAIAKAKAKAEAA
jgi:hypothetical protein